MARVWLKQQPQRRRRRAAATLAIDLPSSIRPCRPNMRFSPLSGLSLLPLKAKAPAAKAERAEHGRRADRRDQGQREQAEHGQSDDRRAGAAIAAPGSKSRTSAASKLRPWPSIVLQRAHHHRPGQRDPGRADQHDQSGAELARLEDVAILRRLAPALGGRRLGFLVRDPARPDMAQPPHARSGAIARGRG